MTTTRLFPSTSGPASPASYTGPYIAGVNFTVSGAAWLDGYWWWVCPSGQSTASVNAALWQVTAATTGTVVSAATVAASGTLTAGQWNFIPLPVPVQLTPGPLYCAAIGSPNNFPDTASQFGSGQPFASGISAGQLFAYADGTAGGSPAAPFGRGQGVFSVASSNAAGNLPSTLSNSSNFWVDVQIDSLPPASQTSFRLYPNSTGVTSASVLDLNVDYTLATEVHFLQQCAALKTWFYSIAGASGLPTRADVWSVGSGLSVASLTSPSWSGAAGSGWVSASWPAGTVLPAGTYRASVFNANGTTGGWSAKDASTQYWHTGAGANGIQAGPLLAPGLAAASNCWEYNGALPGATPPYSNGIQEPGQCPFGQLPSGLVTFPQLYVDGLAQNYWVDLEVTPAFNAPPPLVVAQAVKRAAFY